MVKNARSVLVVGGGLVGLSAALFLAQHRVATVLVEKHGGSSPHPRAIGFPQRTMELLRAVGLGDTVPQIPADFGLVRARVHSLAGEWFEQSSFTPRQGEVPVIVYSPCTAAALAQDQLEPVLRDRAIELGADIRMGTELVGFEQDSEGVSAVLRHGDGREYTLRAAYLIAADGHRSRIRESLAIGRSGRGLIQTMRSVLFRAPLEQYLELGVTQFEIDRPDLKAFLTTYGDGRWVLMFKDDLERDGDGLKQAISSAVGRTDVPVEIITTGRWEISGLIADHFAAGRVFLAGDAAHTLPPARGGYGANTGIADAHNLAWKLAAVLSGASTPALLDSYDAERRPVAWLRQQQIFARPDYQRYANGVAENEPILDEDAIEFGQIYRSSAVLGASDALPVALRPEEWAGQPGTRAPHLWVTRRGNRLSTLDLFQPGWVLLAADARWCAATDDAASASGTAIECVLIGRDVHFLTDGAFEAAFGISASGASLIRPDGHVGWRATELPIDPDQALINAFATISCASTVTADHLTTLGASA